jgi:hypothetical protein
MREDAKRGVIDPSRGTEQGSLGPCVELRRCLCHRTYSRRHDFAKAAIARPRASPRSRGLACDPHDARRPASTAIGVPLGRCGGSHDAADNGPRPRGVAKVCPFSVRAQNPAVACRPAGFFLKHDLPGLRLAGQPTKKAPPMRA